jgi:S-DNA-T family DNA segregation ATPase FtsK/SpoIIIE
MNSSNDSETIASMARVRRKAAMTRLNLEIVGIAALGLAVLLGIALAVPKHSGWFGGSAHTLYQVFGGAAPLFPVLIGVFGVIIFLEINVPRLIATWGLAALGYFLLIDAAFGSHARRARGGFVGDNMWWSLHALLGTPGGWVVLGVAFLALTLWLTNASLKKVIGAGIIAFAWIGALFARLFHRAGKMQMPKMGLPDGHSSLREAFALPNPKDKKKSNARADDDEEDEEDEYDEDDDEEYDDDDEEEDEDDADDEEGDEEDEDADEDEDDDEEDGEDEKGDTRRIVAVGAFVPTIPPPAIVGEYEPAAITAVAAAGAAAAMGAAGASGASAAARLYRLPDLSLFDPPQAQVTDETNRAHLLEDTLASFGVGAKVQHIERGPSITRYELKPERGVKISRIASLADDLALALAATSVRIEAPIPGKSAVGIEVPNATVSVVAVREILDAIPHRGQVPPLWMALGKDITGRPVFGDLAKMPHLLVAGATGSGKSVCLNCIIASLLSSATPDQVQMLMIDPKRVELTVYNGIPHLIKDVITDARLAAGALFEMTKEMDSRYERFAKAGVRKIEEYNVKFPEEKLPYVVIIIDELADLMLVAPARVETTIMRLAQLARATGIHLIVATQRPSVDVITGLIKANIPSRIAFAVSSQVDSRTILDMAGAERLLGRGDMLYLPIDAPKPVRAQGALINGSEVHRLVDFWAKQARPENLLDVEVVPIGDDDNGKKDTDPLCYDAAKFIIERQYASTAQLQSEFSIGHPRAVRIMKQLEEFKVVGPHEGTKPRRIILGLADLEQIAPRLGKNDSQQDMFANQP